MSDYFLPVPEQIKISLTNICNYRCVMCYNPRLKQSRGFIVPDLVQRILKECQELGVSQVALGATGEPLLHKKYLSFLAAARELGLKVSTTSNCSVLTKDISDAIIELGLSRLNISIYSATPEQHKDYTGLDNFYEVVENIKYLLETWFFKKSSMKINMWFLQIPGINDYTDYVKFWKPLADKVGIRLPQKDPINWSGRVGLVAAPGRESRFWLERIPGRLIICMRRRIRCAHVRSYLHILHNGDVLPCCNIPESGNNCEILFGNVNSQSIMDIWQGNPYISFKKDHDSKRIDNYSPCRVCSDIDRVERLYLPPMFLG